MLCGRLAKALASVKRCACAGHQQGLRRASIEFARQCQQRRGLHVVGEAGDSICCGRHALHAHRARLAAILGVHKDRPIAAGKALGQFGSQLMAAQQLYVASARDARALRPSGPVHRRHAEHCRIQSAARGAALHAALPRPIWCRLARSATGAAGPAERHRPRPVPQGVYAVTKCEGERAAAAWGKHLIVRSCGLYLPRPSHATGRNFVKTILRLARMERKLRVVDDQWCTPTYVPHVALGVIVYLLGIEVVVAGAVGDLPRDESRRDDLGYHFAREIVRLAALDVPVEAITTADFAAPAPRPAYSVLDTAAYHRLGGPAMPDWKEALGEYFAELKQVES